MAPRLAPEAVTDLGSIWAYVAKDASVDIADRLIDSVTHRFLLLATYPQMGRARDDLRPGMRSFPVAQYLILYRVESGDVEVLRIIHGHRDIEALFSP